MQLAVLTTYFNYLFGRRYIVLMLALAMLVRCIFLLRPEVGAPRIMAGCTPPAIAQNIELAWEFPNRMLIGDRNRVFHEGCHLALLQPSRATAMQLNACGQGWKVGKYCFLSLLVSRG